MRQTPSQKTRVERLIRTANHELSGGTTSYRSSAKTFDQVVGPLNAQRGSERFEAILVQVEKAKKLNPTRDQLRQLWEVYHLAQHRESTGGWNA
jgi:hypothetical protein